MSEECYQIGDSTTVGESSAIRTVARNGFAEIKYSAANPPAPVYRPGGSLPSKYESYLSKTNDSSR
jgi:hypothetical protein